MTEIIRGRTFITMDNEKNPLDQLVGEELSAVSFVRDYVEIHFEGLKVQFMADPSVVENGRRFLFPTNDAIVKLVGLIGSVVKSIKLISGSYEFMFEGGSTIAADQYGGPDGETFFFINNGSREDKTSLLF